MQAFSTCLFADLSTDYSTLSKTTYTANNRIGRPATKNLDDDDEHSEEYRKILGKTDVTLTLSKYSSKDSESLKVDNMIEEERRGKAYSKIINQSSAAQLVSPFTQPPLLLKSRLTGGGSPLMVVLVE